MAVLHHFTADQFGAEKNGEIQVDDALPVFEGLFFNGEIDELTADVVDEDVDGAMSGERLAAGGFAFCGVPDVGGDRNGVTTQCTDLVCGAMEAVKIASGEDDVGPCLGEGEGHLAA